MGFGLPAGKLGLDYAGPYSLLFFRFSCAAIIMLVVSLFTKAKWPRSFTQYAHLIIVGFLVQGAQFAALYTGMNMGVSAGVAALIIGTLPVFTALVAGIVFNEKVNAKRWFGAFLGVFGVGLVVLHEIGFSHATALGYVFSILGLVCITTGTIYQKRFCGTFDLRTGTFIQLVTASLFVMIFAWHFERFHVTWGLGFIGCMSWLSLVNSIGAFTVLFVLLKRGEASKVSSLFHLIPGVAAVMSYFVLGETLTLTVLTGFIITGLAVYLSH